MNILVVEDEPAVRDSVRRALELKGYRVETAVDGPKALIAARGTERDAIVLDVMLHGGLGTESGLSRRVKRSALPEPVLRRCARDGLHNERVSRRRAGRPEAPVRSGRKRTSARSSNAEP
jgi:DNA-binding response OmpR family regulator